jgi:hypothetical protein
VGARTPEDLKLSQVLSPIAASISSAAADNKKLKELTLFDKYCILPAKRQIPVREFMISGDDAMSGEGCSVSISIESAGLVLGSVQVRAEAGAATTEGASIAFALLDGHPPRLVVSTCDSKSTEHQILDIPLI